jgi:hypothetical protein
LAFFCCSLFPLSLFPLSPISASPYWKRPAPECRADPFSEEQRQGHCSRPSQATLESCGEWQVAGAGPGSSTNVLLCCAALTICPAVHIAGGPHGSACPAGPTHPIPPGDTESAAGSPRCWTDLGCSSRRGPAAIRHQAGRA